MTADANNDAIQTARAKALNRADLYARWERTPQAAQALAERANLCDDMDDLITVVERETLAAMPCYRTWVWFDDPPMSGFQSCFTRGDKRVCPPCQARIPKEQTT